MSNSYYDSKEGFDALYAIEAFGLNFSLGNVLKYIVRAGKKPGATAIEDLTKAKVYIEREIERLGRVEQCQKLRTIKVKRYVLRRIVGAPTKSTTLTGRSRQLKHENLILRRILI